MVMFSLLEYGSPDMVLGHNSLNELKCSTFGMRLSNKLNSRVRTRNVLLAELVHLLLY